MSQRIKIDQTWEYVDSGLCITIHDVLQNEVVIKEKGKESSLLFIPYEQFYATFKQQEYIISDDVMLSIKKSLNKRIRT